MLEGEPNAEAKGPRVLEEEGQTIAAVDDHTSLGSCFRRQIIAGQELVDVRSKGVRGSRNDSHSLLRPNGLGV